MRRRISQALTLLLAMDYASAIDVLSSTPALIAPPSLNTDSIGDILLGGSFDGISQLRYSGQSNLFVPARNYSDDLFARRELEGDEIFLKQSFSDGLIHSSCMMGDNETYVLVGNFSSILNETVPNGIAAVNFANGSVIAIPGDDSFTNMNGSNVNTVWCNKTSAYFGGSFRLNTSHGAGVWNQESNSISLPTFGGFTSDAVINAIVPLDDSLVFGGSFSGLSIAFNSSNGNLNGSFLQPGMQPVSLALANATGYGSENATGVDASQILCPGASNSGWTADLDSSTGHIDVDFAYTVLPTKIRLFNLADGSGTKVFRIISNPVGSFMNLTYIDEKTGEETSCSAFCPLPERNDSITFTDFSFVNVVPSTSLSIVLLDFYGTHPGLNGIQLFEQGQHAFAYNALNNPRDCQNSGSSASKVTSSSEFVGGSWSVMGDYMHTNITDRSQLTSIYAQLNPTFGYYAIDRGIYEILLYTPGCNASGTCGMRGIVNVTVFPGFGNPTFTTIYQTNEEFKYDLIYNGTLQSGAYIRITPTAQNQLPMELVAYEATLNYLGANVGYNATNLFQYLPSNFTNSTIAVPVGNTSVNLFGYEIGAGASINSLLVNSSASSLLIGGSNFPTNISSDSSNLVEIGVSDDENTDSIHAVGIGGIPNSVGQLHDLNGTTFVFSNSDAYTLIGDSVNSVGFNAEVSSVSGFVFNGTFYWAFSSTSADKIMLWDPDTKNIADESIQQRISGHITGNYEIGNATLYSGSLEIIGERTPGGVALVPPLQKQRSSSTSPYTFKLQRSSGSNLVARDTGNTTTASTEVSRVDKINGGCFLNSSDYLVIGQFAAETTGNNTAYNALIVSGGNTSSPFITTSQSDFIESNSTVFNAAAEFEGIVAVGGQFSGKLSSKNVKDLILFDTNSSTFLETQPEPLNSDSSAFVNGITFRPNSSEIIVAGSFSSSRSSNVTCNGLCAYDISKKQWNDAPFPELSGNSNINTVLFESGTKMLVAGNFSLANDSSTRIQVATYDFNSSTGSFTQLPVLPAPPSDVVILSNGTSRQAYAAAGHTPGSNNAPFVRIYDSETHKWTDIPNNPFGSQSVISSLSTVQVNVNVDTKSTNSSTSYPFVDGRALILSGNLEFNGMSGVSMALYNGTNWVPMYGTSSSKGLGVAESGGLISSVFSQFGGNMKGGTMFSRSVASTTTTPLSPTTSSTTSAPPAASSPNDNNDGRKHRGKMPTGHVVGIACGIGIGCVILMSALYMLIEFMFNLGRNDPSYQLLAQPKQGSEIGDSPKKKR